MGHFVNAQMDNSPTQTTNLNGYQDLISINGTVQKSSVQAILSKGRAYIPARVVLEAFGAKVSWNADSRLVLVATKNGLPTLTALDLKQLRFQAHIIWLEGSLPK
ncbi:copper amine oxidase N-terminal domain-containing protein [Paenibacillus pinisoli]|uniref:Copper amine oxidase N-terminal domain-containing protein n=1 Tax=Paenibacillus pinisoli TaxID=1276110 RepID=A0A3A6PYV8_9BACL|nr:copper amine oxidase N-terminal domain-containing protein [Paenibacillus pinisoli]RJX40503.1 copper amine oxidase N-terminal domain-containing protein [Paenibacillus pinisoli]